MLVCVGVLVDLWVFGGSLSLAERIVRDAYNNTSFEWINYIFHIVASDAYKTPVSVYIAKLVQVALWFRFLFSFIFPAIAYWSFGKVSPGVLNLKLRPWLWR